MAQNTEILKSVRPDFSVFCYPAPLGQHCGVPPERMRRLVVKELVDNALDAGFSCEMGELSGGGFYVQDDGPGLPVEDLDRLFSVGRPMESTKLERMPTRGALGNGLRVVTGAIIASEGRITVWTHDHKCVVIPKFDGSKATVEKVPADFPTGTRIEVHLGPVFPEDPNVLSWGQKARELARAKDSTDYKGKPSPWWYSVDAFHELCQSVPEIPVRALVSRFEGCSGGKAGEVAAVFLDKAAGKLTKEEIEDLLTRARTYSKQVKPERLGFVGEMTSWPAYAKVVGTVDYPCNGSISATLPYVVEVWAMSLPEAKMHTAQIFVNRTPAVGGYNYWGTGKTFTMAYGEGEPDEEYEHVKAGSVPLVFWLNIQSPYVPLLSNSKAPNLTTLAGVITEVMEKAARKVRRTHVSANGESEKKRTQKSVIVGALPEAIKKASGDGEYRYSIRQLFYAVRPYLIDQLGIELEYGWFSDVIKAHESELGKDLPGIYRDDRGTLHHPHTGESIPVGTLSVEAYRRPEWMFNKILYCEKEGFFEILKSTRWPERHDCALLTSKGYASAAARDLLDYLGDSGEDLEFFMIHDADGYGTTIYQSLVEATKTRPGRRVHVVNLGLEPEEAVAMGLQVEAVQSKKAVAVAGYIPNIWKVWLQKNRAELNAMTSPQFLAWLTLKFESATGKLIPPGPVLLSHQEQIARDTLRDRITARILREADIDGQVDDAYQVVNRELSKDGAALAAMIREGFADDPAVQWTEPIRTAVTRTINDYEQWNE